MDYTTWTVPSVERGLNAQEDIPPLRSLYRALQEVPDPRRGQGKRYELALLLCFLLLAKLAGQTTLSGATDWIRHRSEQVAQAFGLPHHRMPCQMTYCRLLARLDAQFLDEVLAAFFTRWEAQERCAAEPSRLRCPQGHREHEQLAIDGKTVRATRTQAHRVHQLSCYDVTTGVVLWQHNVELKENEISALKPLITEALVRGRICTLDAMHTQCELCALIHRLAGAYVLIAKDNQPTLLEDSADLFEDQKPDRRRWQTAETWNKGHGRIEHRQIVCSPDLNDWFAKRWVGIEQVFRLERTSRLTRTGELRHQVVYGLSNLSLVQAPPSRMLELVRRHWLIEIV